MNTVQVPEPTLDTRWMADAACARFWGMPWTESRIPGPDGRADGRDLRCLPGPGRVRAVRAGRRDHRGLVGRSITQRPPTGRLQPRRLRRPPGRGLTTVARLGYQ